MMVGVFKMCFKTVKQRYFITLCCFGACVVVMNVGVLRSSRHLVDVRTASVSHVVPAILDVKPQHIAVPKAQATAPSMINPDPISGGLNFTAVVIVAYMRSGSTLLGNIVQHDPSVFYVFEPLRKLEQDFQFTMTGVFGDKLNFEKRRPSMVTRKESLHIHRAWLTCDLPAILSVRHRFSTHFFVLGHKTNPLSQCLNFTGDSHFQNYTINEECVRNVRRACLESKVRVIKTIRTPMDWLHDLMVEFPSMKIIHLVRDPRAIANSYKGFDHCHWKHEPNAYLKCLQHLCGQIEDDLFPYEIFTHYFPGRMSRLYFEDLANMTETLSEKMYQWLGLSFTERTKEYIHNMTRAGMTPKGELDTVRPNSKDVIVAWRKELHPSYVYTVESLCVYSMKKLMYQSS